MNPTRTFSYNTHLIRKEKYPIIGVMLESNLKEGNQFLDPLNLRFGKSITDPCINFEKTKDLIKAADEKFSPLGVHLY